ncbi:hypothetical protein HSHS1_06310 [Helicobacter suis HS1]|nr:hypothetical protein HSHS1_06310 [Helicobacter suis HS1]
MSSVYPFVHFSPLEAVEYLGTMLGGYFLKELIEALQSSDTEIAKAACNALKATLLVYNSFEIIAELSQTNALAQEVLESWANAEWFLNKPALSSPSL